MPDFTFSDGIPQYEPGIPNTPTFINTDLITSVSSVLRFNDATRSGPPEAFRLAATIIASWGGIGSNSYVSITQATSFIQTAIVDNSAWLEADWRLRTAAILEATRDIDSLNFVGARYFYDQTLLFPRGLEFNFPWNRTGTSSTIWSVSMRRMEEDVNKAACWQTVHILRERGRDRATDAIVSGIRTRNTMMGPSFENIGYSRSPSRLCKEALDLLREWRSSKRVIRG